MFSVTQYIVFRKHTPSDTVAAFDGKGIFVLDVRYWRWPVSNGMG